MKSKLAQNCSLVEKREKREREREIILIDKQVAICTKTVFKII